MLVLSLLMTAHAAVPAWNWPAGQPVKYHIETDLLMPRGAPVKAKANTDARVGGVHLTADTECVAKAVGKNREVVCQFAYLRFTGTPLLPSEAEGTIRVMEEWSQDLLGAEVVMFLGGDGRLKEFDIRGLSAENLRIRDIQEVQRIYLMRSFAVFDFPLSEDADDWKRGWTEKGSSLIFGLVTQRGTVGAGSFDHKPLGEADGLYSITTTGHAAVTPGEAIDAGGLRMVDMRVSGSTQIDVAKGLIAWRDFTIDGRLTASSAESGGDAEFGQVTAIQLVDRFEPGGGAPLPLAAERAPRIENPPPELPTGVDLVPFAELGMQPLFVPHMPPAGKAQQFPTNHVFARVIVGPDGMPTSVVAFRGYAALIEHCQQALRGAKFTARGKPYAVDVDVEYRAD